MNGEAIISVTAAVVAIVQILKASAWCVRHALVLLFAVSALAVGLWAYSAGALTQATAFQLFAGWAAVSLSAAGVFGVVRATPDQVTAFRKPKE